MKTKLGEKSKLWDKKSQHFDAIRQNYEIKKQNNDIKVIIMIQIVKNDKLINSFFS